MNHVCTPLIYTPIACHRTFSSTQKYERIVYVVGTCHSINQKSTWCIFQVLYVYRNPKDTMVSLYHFNKARINFGAPRTFDPFARDFMEDWCLNAPYFEHLEQYFKLQKTHSNILLVSYAALTRVNAVSKFRHVPFFSDHCSCSFQTPIQTIGRIAEFLSKSLSRDQI